jgi:hypothetical protein
MSTPAAHLTKGLAVLATTIGSVVVFSGNAQAVTVTVPFDYCVNESTCVNVKASEEVSLDRIADNGHITVTAADQTAKTEGSFFDVRPADARVRTSEGMIGATTPVGTGVVDGRSAEVDVRQGTAQFAQGVMSADGGDLGALDAGSGARVEVGADGPSVTGHGALSGDSPVVVGGGEVRLGTDQLGAVSE